MAPEVNPGTGSSPLWSQLCWHLSPQQPVWVWVVSKSPLNSQIKQVHICSLQTTGAAAEAMKFGTF